VYVLRAAIIKAARSSKFLKKQKQQKIKLKLQCISNITRLTADPFYRLGACRFVSVDFPANGATGTELTDFN